MTLKLFFEEKSIRNDVLYNNLYVSDLIMVIASRRIGNVGGRNDLPKPTHIPRSFFVNA